MKNNTLTALKGEKVGVGTGAMVGKFSWPVRNHHTSMASRYVLTAAMLLQTAMSFKFSAKK